MLSFCLLLFSALLVSLTVFLCLSSLFSFLPLVLFKSISVHFPTVAVDCARTWIRGRDCKCLQTKGFSLQHRLHRPRQELSEAHVLRCCRCKVLYAEDGEHEPYMWRLRCPNQNATATLSNHRKIAKPQDPES